MNKADLVDKIAGACEISKAQATTAIDTAVSSITGALTKRRSGSVDRFWNFLGVAEEGAETGAILKLAPPSKSLPARSRSLPLGPN